MKGRYLLYTLFLILIATILLNKLTIKRQDQDRNVSKKSVNYKELPTQQESTTSKKLKRSTQSKALVDEKEVKEKIDSILYKLKLQVDADIYAEDYIPLILELEDLIIDNKTQEYSTRYLFKLIEQGGQSIPIKAICIFVIAAKASEFAINKFLDLLHKEDNERIQKVIIAAVIRPHMRYKLSVDDRTDFWKGAFVATGYINVFGLKYLWQYWHKKYGNEIYEPGWPHESSMHYPEFPGDATFGSVLYNNDPSNFYTNLSVKETLRWYLLNAKSMDNKLELLNLLPNFNRDVDDLCVMLFKDKTVPRRLRSYVLRIKIGSSSVEYRWKLYKELIDYAGDLEMRSEVIQEMFALVHGAKREKETFVLLDKELKIFYHEQTFSSYGAGSEDRFDGARYIRRMIDFISGIETRESRDYIYNLYRTTPYNYIRQAILENMGSCYAREDKLADKGEADFLQWVIFNEPDGFLRFKAAKALYRVIKNGTAITMDKNSLIRQYEYLRDTYRDACKETGYDIEINFNDTINLIRNQ